MNYEQKLEELFIDLPVPRQDRGVSVSVVQNGKLVHICNCLPFSEGRIQYKGKVGLEVRMDMSKLAAKLAAVYTIAVLREHLGGSLAKVKKLIRVDGAVACTSDFAEHEKVIDGAMDFFQQIFGINARGVRSVVGSPSLPENSCVSISCIFEIK